MRGAIKKLLSADEYSHFVRRLVTDYFSLDFFKRYYNNSEFAGVMASYLSCAVDIYKNWSAEPENARCSLERLTEETATLFMHGLNGFDTNGK